MTKLLLVGDVHATVDSLPECTKLIDLIEKIALQERVSSITFMGDLYHNFAVVRLEVMDFWRKTFRRLAGAQCDPTPLNIDAIVGNHDIVGGTNTQCHALQAHYEQITVTEGASFAGSSFDIPIISYQSDPDSFLKMVDLCVRPEKLSNTILCHQTLLGARYDNGFYAPDGIDVSGFPEILFISGHIHTQQSFGNVWYLGSPRWLTLSDANQPKAIWVVEFDKNGKLLNKTPFDTSACCTPILKIEETPDNLYDKAKYENANLTVDLHGPESWIKERRGYWVGHRVRPFVDSQHIVTVRESEGIGKAFRTYLSAFNPPNGSNKEELMSMAKERCSILK